MRNIINRWVEKAKREYYSKRLINEQNRSKYQWKIIHEIIGKKRKASLKLKKLKTSSATWLQILKKVSNTFNDYFVNVGQELASKIPAAEYNIKSPLERPFLLEFRY